MQGATRSLIQSSGKGGTDGVPVVPLPAPAPWGSLGGTGQGRVGATLGWEEHWAAAIQCLLPKPLGCVHIDPGEPQSPVWPWGGCAWGLWEHHLSIPHLCTAAVSRSSWKDPSRSPEAWTLFLLSHGLWCGKKSLSRVLFHVRVNKVVQRWQSFVEGDLGYSLVL